MVERTITMTTTITMMIIITTMTITMAITVIREQPEQRRGANIVSRPSSSRPPVDRRFAWKVSAERLFRLSDFSLRVGSMHD